VIVLPCLTYIPKRYRILNKWVQERPYVLLRCRMQTRRRGTAHRLAKVLGDSRCHCQARRRLQTQNPNTLLSFMQGASQHANLMKYQSLCRSPNAQIGNSGWLPCKLLALCAGRGSTMKKPLCLQDFSNRFKNRFSFVPTKMEGKARSLVLHAIRAKA
jgi:hypothetical protein